MCAECCELCVCVCAGVLCNQSVAQFLPHFTQWPKSLLVHLFVCLFACLFICSPSSFFLLSLYTSDIFKNSTQPSAATDPTTFDYTFDILVQDDKEIDFCCFSAVTTSCPASVIPPSLKYSQTLKCPKMSRLESCETKLGARLFIENWVIAHRKIEKVALFVGNTLFAFDIFLCNTLQYIKVD